MSKKPNIIFLFNDHQAYYRHGWDEGPKPARPNFDRVGREGITFDHAYTCSGFCVPARASVVTGLYPHNHGLLTNAHEIPFKEGCGPYFPYLKEEGYRCCYYGKWHTAPGTASDYGCEGFSCPSYGNPYQSTEYKEYCKKRGLPEAKFYVEHSFWPDVVPEKAEYTCKRVNWSNEHASGLLLTPEDTHEAYFLANMVSDKLEELAEKDEPFALKADFWGPHQPYFPSRRFADMYDPESIPEYGSFRDDLTGKPFHWRNERNKPLQDGHNHLVIPNPLAWDEWQEVLARCYAHITMVDDAAGRILDTLDRLGLSENTFVIWTTDHGDGIAAHGGHFDKSNYMSEEIYRIPMTIRWPEVIAPGQTSNALVSNLDVAPTILDAAGTRFKGEVDGDSLLPVCRGDKNFSRSELVCEAYGHKEDIISRMIVTDRYKYIATQDKMHELYDLKADPYELCNQINNPSFSNILKDLRIRLRSWQEKTGDKERV